jgi:hypothetical protein
LKGITSALISTRARLTGFDMALSPPLNVQ